MLHDDYIHLCSTFLVSLISKRFLKEAIMDFIVSFLFTALGLKTWGLNL